jgi:hypothetical protein
MQKDKFSNVKSILFSKDYKREIVIFSSGISIYSSFDS